VKVIKNEQQKKRMTDSCSNIDMADRVRGALYGLLIADAMAMPTHWLYGGPRQVQQLYGSKIKGFVAPVSKLPGSIMSKSDTGGGGRGGFSGDVIGNVIFHGKKKFWAPGADYHYHQGMKAGDNTIEALLMRRVLSVTAKAGGKFDKEAITNDYIKFLTTPKTHNDTYCPTAHRMFFANFAAGKPPAQCPDNDGHNVDTTDPFITTVPIALLSASDEQASADAREMVLLTRDSKKSAPFAAKLCTTLRGVVRGADLRTSVIALGKELGYDVKRDVERGGQDPLQACYFDQSMPAVLYMVYKYSGEDDVDAANFETAVLANANRGGENVATGSVIGALLGAAAGFKNLPKHLVEGLAPGARDEIESEVNAFISSTPFLK